MSNNIEKTITAAHSGGSDPNIYSALTLAYLGDCVYEMYVRSYLVSDGNHKVCELHKATTKYVCAASQAEFFHKIEGMLANDELAAFKRGRNAKSHPPKNADVIDYKIATGVETLIGYLYIIGETERISELMSHLFK